MILPLYRDRIQSLARHMRPEIADDLGQVGMIALWKALESYDERKGALPSYLLRRARGQMSTFLARMNDREVPAGEDMPDFWPSDDDPESEAIREADREFLKDRVFRAVCALPDTQRKYVLLRFYEDCGHPMLKHIFGYNPTAVWRGARDNLRELLADLK